jgi:UDP-N-acetylmuramyl pentapeptide phosphotransferase/UDP-N-acetylglucosamine-1-phosphate transferase
LSHLLIEARMIAAPFASGIASALLIAFMLRMKQALPMDRPNHRSLHQSPIPRTGGIGILLGIITGWLLVGPSSLLPLLVLVLGLGALSLMDDFRGLSAGLRLAVQLAAAALFVVLRPDFPGGLIGAGLAVLGLTWASNLYNFMDGSNGLAGGMALFGFSFYAILGWHGGAFAFSAASACVAGAALGFLFFNFDPARIFMGDSGSVPLGFLAAGLGIIGWQDGLWPLAFPVLVFSPFVVDASVTLLKRLLRGEKIWQAHREHYYQRLVRMGLGHRGTALAEYVLMIACGGSALLLVGLSALLQITILATWLVFYGLVMRRIDQAWARYDKESST